MFSEKSTVLATRIFTWLVLVMLAAACIAAPWLLRWFTDIRNMSEKMYILLTCFYVCAVPAAAAMIHMLLLLRDIRREQVFTPSCVHYINVISWCCLAAAGILLMAVFAYLPLIFVVVALVFMFLITRVVSDVIRAAAVIKDENDRTI